MNHSLLPSVRDASLPAKYEAAKIALSECSSVDECKGWADKAAALASYAKQSQDKEMEKTAMRIRARAVRRCGELLKEVEKGQPGPKPKELKADTDPQLSRKIAAKSAKLTPRQAKDAIRVANVAPRLFDEQVDGEEPPTVTALAEQGKKPAKGKPLYERLGMTKAEFQSGMYFQGELERYLYQTSKHEPKDVAAGSTPEQRKIIRKNMLAVDEYHRRLRAQL